MAVHSTCDLMGRLCEGVCRSEREHGDRPRDRENQILSRTIDAMRAA